MMKLTIWGIALTAGIGLALATLGERVGPTTWSVVTLLLAGAGSRRAQPKLAMLLFGIAGTVSIGAVARDQLEIGAAASLISLLLVALTGVAWRRQWRQMRRDIVHEAIDRQLVAVDLPGPRETPHSRELIRNMERPMPGTQTSDVNKPIKIHRRRA
jgi:hypothetical protein